jgi:formylmethanofuran dehydrogenase subunit D
MRLQKQLSRVHKDKAYPKYTIVIPPKEVEKLGWKEGDEIEPNSKNGELILKLKKNTI